jgi:hypothetical protein
MNRHLLQQEALVRQLQYVSIRQYTSVYVSIRQHTSAYVSIRQHTSAYVTTCCSKRCSSDSSNTSAYVSIRQHTSAYVSIRQHTSPPAAARGARQTASKTPVAPQVSAFILWYVVSKYFCSTSGVSIRTLVCSKQVLL